MTAFLLAGQPARPFWHTGVMAPRFIASAFASGAALLLLLARHWPEGTGEWGEKYLRRLFLACLGLDLFLLGSRVCLVVSGLNGQRNGPPALRRWAGDLE